MRRRTKRLRSIGAAAGRSFANIIWRCRFASCANSSAGCAIASGSANDEGAIVKLTAIVITKNEAHNIAGCLDSLAFCDERIVVDSGSTDETVRLAEGKGARVTQHAFEGFGAQKNVALSLAQGEWVLSLDADERVSKELADEIIKAATHPAADCYEMPRLSSFCGRPMRHSGWFPDYVLRLFRRGKARFSDDLVHERVIYAGRVMRLEHPLIHHPVLRLEDALSRMDGFSTAGAEVLVA